MAAGKDRFSSKTGFVLALAGSAIGLGNIWRFPYMVGEYGGAAFIIIYILCSLLLSVPIFYCELIVGRKKSETGLGSGKSGLDIKLVGLFCAATCFIIASFYSVVGGWSLDYLGMSLAKGFRDVSTSGVEAAFSQATTLPLEALGSFFLFLGLTALIVRLGVGKGIEKFSKISIPVLIIIMVALAIYSVTLPGASAGINYLVHPDFSKVTGKTITYAMGQAFFSLSVGQGTIMTYSLYMSRKDNMVTSGLLTAGFDTLFAIIAGFVIMPAVFSAGIEPGAGPALIFETIPYIFGTIGRTAPLFGRILLALFFLSVFTAALTSEISVFECCVTKLREKISMSRNKACTVVFILVSVLGSLCALSFGVLSEVKIAGKIIFDFFENLSSTYMLSIGALMFSLFVGWRMGKEEVYNYFTNGGTVNVRVFKLFYAIVKWVSPIGIVLIFVSNLF